jgi:hypothetical protein
MIRFNSLDNLFKSCNDHLDAFGQRESAIESIFVQHILIRICAEFEIKLVALAESRLRSNDAPTKAISRAMLRREFKAFDIGNLTSILGKFNPDYKAKFSSEIVNSTSHLAWDSIYNNRVTVAHKIGIIQLSFPELESHYKESLKVFDAMINALECKPRELKGLI